MDGTVSNAVDGRISQAQIKALDAICDHEGYVLDDLAHDLIGKQVLDLSRSEASEIFSFLHGEHPFSPCNTRIDKLGE